jgi:hypothetical protein
MLTQNSLGRAADHDDAIRNRPLDALFGERLK